LAVFFGKEQLSDFRAGQEAFAMSFSITGLQDDDRYDDNGDIPAAPIDALAAMGIGPPISDNDVSRY
jgi:hypothetical protein